MRRWLAILIFLCMPLQFSFAACSAYCEQESGSTAAHGKQHEHQHKTEAELGGGSAPEAIGHMDIDSAHCHSGGTTAISGSVQLPAVTASPCTTRIEYAMRALSPPPLSPPERPKWTALA